MAISLRNLVYSKCIEDTDLHHKLITLVNSKNWLEDLIDLIIEFKSNENGEIENLTQSVETLETENSKLEEQKEELEQRVKETEEELEKLKKENKWLSAIATIGDVSL